ncbi:DUF2681 domain-containing protein [Frederiksenia canicola]
MTSLLAIISAIVVIVAVVAYKLWSANREIERVLRVNADLEQTNQQQKAEIQTKKAEIKNAQIKQKNHDDVKRSNASNVDQQLQQHGWFRAEDSGHGLPSVQPDLPKPSRHGGDQAADTGSQSDSSGDM